MLIKPVYWDIATKGIFSYLLKSLSSHWTSHFIIMYQELYIPNNTNCPSIISFPSGIGLCNKGSPAPGSQNIMRDVVFMAGEQQVEDH